SLNFHFFFNGPAPPLTCVCTPIHLFTSSPPANLCMQPRIYMSNIYVKGAATPFSLYFFAFLSCLFFFLHVILHLKSKKAKKKVRKSRESALFSLLFLNFFLSRV